MILHVRKLSFGLVFGFLGTLAAQSSRECKPLSTGGLQSRFASQRGKAVILVFFGDDKFSRDVMKELSRLDQRSLAVFPIYYSHEVPAPVMVHLEDLPFLQPCQTVDLDPSGALRSLGVSDTFAQVSATPTLWVFNDSGAVVDKIVGLVTAEELVRRTRLPGVRIRESQPKETKQP